jgi:hypothetical protein
MQAVAASLYDEGAVTVIYAILVNCRFMLERSSNSYGKSIIILVITCYMSHIWLNYHIKYRETFPFPSNMVMVCITFPFNRIVA